MALEAGEHQKQRQGHGAASGNGNPGGGIRHPARRSGGDDTEAAGGEERAGRVRGGAVAGGVLPVGLVMLSIFETHCIHMLQGRAVNSLSL